MAVTFHQIPAAYSPSDNPLMYRFSSNQTAQANFSFIVKATLGGTVLIESKIFPEVGIYAHYDASDVVKYKIPKPILTNVLAQSNGTMLNLSLTVTENYGTTPINQASATSTITRTWKSSLSSEDFLLKDFNADYKGKLFLTNTPRSNNIQVLRGQDVYLEQIVDTGGLVSLFLRFYNSAGVLLDTITTGYNFPIWQLNLKDTIITDMAPVDILNVAYFTVQIGTSEILTIEYFDDYCNKPFALMWMNEYGAFDQFIFKHNNELSYNVDSSSYRSQFGSWVGNAFVYSVVNSGLIDYVKNIKHSGTITTDFVSEAFQNYLIELFNSPFYLLTDVSGYVITITVTNNGYKEDQSRFDELLMLEVNYTKSSSHKSLTI